ncbi:MAG: efflux transporter periplasmic adaptor subunit, partial [Planktomarina sp.]|nr:efflux transporter periplasmic adaptor subunit [Planktomarina sp.]
MRFLRKSLTGLFLLGATLALFAFAFSMVRSAIEDKDDGQRRGGGPRERIFAVNVIPFEAGQQTPILQVFGEVQSQRSLDIRAAVGGTVIELHPDFQNGGQVNEGDIILRIDPSNADTALALVRADMADAQADLLEATRALELARDEVSAARQQAALRLKALKRQNDLVERGVGTEASVETAEFAVSSANQAILTRRQSFQAAEARLNKTEARVLRVGISLTEAERNLRDTVLRATFSGSLANVVVVKGGTVANNERIGQLVDPLALEVAFRVSTSQHQRLLDDDGVLRNSKISVTLDVLGAEMKTKGVLTREAAVVGEGLSGRLLFASLLDVKSLRPGDFVTVDITEPPLNWVAKLPASALSGNNKVLVVGEGERLTEAEVTLVRRQGNDVLVRSRELRDAKVVAERSPVLGSGIKVRVIVADGSEEPEAPAMVKLEPERRAKLIAFLEANKRIPKAVKKRMLNQLAQPEVPSEMVERLESRMGG